MMQVEPFTPQDLPVLPALKPEGWSDLAPIFQFYVASRFCFPIKVTSDSVTIGVGCAIRFQDSAWLAHIIVHPRHRRRGVGTVIVEHLLDELTDLRVESISLVATNDGYPLYLKLGFTEDREYAFYEKGTSSTGTEKPASVEAAAPSDYGEILELDRIISGERRGPLLAPHLSTARVAREAGSISGVSFPTLGEGLIEAARVDSGIGLLSERLLTHTTCTLPAENEAAVGFLTGNGYKEFLRAWRMTRGVRPSWHPQWIFSRIAGSLG